MSHAVETHKAGLKPSKADRRRPPTKIANLSLVTCSLLISFIIGELAIRFLGSYDADGSFNFFDKTLKPFRLPVSAMKEKVEQLSLPSTVIAYDPLLGWAPRPNSKSTNGLYRYNSLGIRSTPSEYSMFPSANTVRIGVFGDSFSHGDGVPFEQTWGYHLESKLKQSGLAVEVINFGVGGYGMDQAFLRWRNLGHKLSPHVVILGLHLENLNRNVNLIRAAYFRHTGLPFSKPRFLLNGDGLELINVPTPAPEKLLGIMKDIGAWQLTKYEYFVDPEDYQTRAWHMSKFASLIVQILHRKRSSSSEAEDPSFCDPSRERAQLGMRIVHEFKRTVEAQNGRFLLVHLPNRPYLQELMGRKSTCSALLKKIEEDNDVVRPESDMVKDIDELSLHTLFGQGGHYSARGNELVANALTKYIVSDSRLALLFSRPWRETPPKAPKSGPGAFASTGL